MQDIKKKAVTALLFNEKGEILSVSRKNDYNDIGLPGGKLDSGETLEQALIRELKEETGLTAIDFSPVYVDEDESFICTTFHIQSYSGDIQSSEKGKIRWVTFNELNSGCFGAYNKLLETHLISSFDNTKVNARPAVQLPEIKSQGITPEKNDAVNCLKELIEMYHHNTDSEGQPKASVIEMVELWNKAKAIVQSHGGHGAVKISNSIDCSCEKPIRSKVTGRCELCHKLCSA